MTPRTPIHIFADPQGSADHSGLYDPVLDDSEYVYVPFDLDDLDQESNVDQLKEKPLRTEELIDKSKSTDFAVHVLSETGVQPTILKQNYKDVFPELNVEELPPEIKYRLPISEQYDPEGKRVTMLYGYNKHSFVDVERLNYLAKEYGKLMQNKGLATENETTDRSVFKTQKFSTNEYNRFQRNDEKLDLSQIEETAAYVVDKNLDRAVSAANIIKKEIGTKLNKISILEEMTSKLYEQSTEKIYKEHFSEKEKITRTKSSSTEADIEHKKETSSTEEIKKEVSVAEEIKKFETLDMQMDSKLNTEERKLLRQQDIEEAIEAGTVRHRTEMFKKEPGSRKLIENETFKILACDKNTSNFQFSKQRAYNLGLQIIPHIRKATQISQHGHLLFKIFIMQLTKVMLALSKFILLDKNKYLHEKSDSFTDGGEIIKKAKLSGAQIAQIEGLKPEELTDKMDIVISEFLRKCGKQVQYFEKKYSDCKSRSRSNSKSNREVVKSKGVSFEPKTMISEKRTLQETYETKKNSIEIRNIKSEKRYSELRSSKMDSKVNLNENEKKTADDGNIIYIAIVEAHVYTNKDAIFEEQLKTMSENRYDSDVLDLGKVYYRCEVSVTYRDFRESSLPPTVIIESIEEIPSEQVYDEEKQEIQETDEQSVLGYEEIAKKLAVQKITEVLEPLLMIKEIKSVNIKHAYPVIETPLKTITETTNLTMEKETENTFQETIWSKKSHALIEKPVKSVVETSVVSVEDESGFVDILEFTEQKPQPIIEETAKSIAETTEFIEDEKVETIDCTQQVLRTAQPVFECSVKSVPEITKIVTDETKINILNISKPSSVIPHYKMSNNLKSVAETIATVEEPETDMLNILNGMSVIPHCAISNNLLSIAETFTATTEEPKQENLDIVKLSKAIISVGVDKNFATEVAEIYSEESVQGEIVKLEIKERHSDEFFEKPLLILPETNMVLTEEPISETLSLLEPLNKEAKINVKLTDIPMCAQVTEIIPNEKEQNTFDVTGALENQPFELREKPVLSVVTTATVLPFEPKEETLNIDKLRILDACITVEESQATEITIVRSEEPKEDNLNICKGNNKWPNINMESSMLSVAEKLSVPLQGPDYEDLEIPNLGVKSLQKLVQNTGLHVAESLLIIPNGPESGDFIVSGATNEQAKIIVDESKASTTSVVYLEEPKSENLELPIVEEKQPRFSIQDCALTLVTKEEILPGSPNYDDLKPFMYEKDIGESEIDECKAILVTITTCEEPKHKNLEIPTVIEKQFKTYIETPQLTVAETATIVPEFCNNVFDIEDTDGKATVNFTEIENYETTEITAVEPKEKNFEQPIIKQQRLVANMEEVHLLTAESSLIIPEISTNTFSARKTDKHQVNVDVVENKGIETFLVRPLESSFEKLEISTVAKKHPETLLETPVLAVAETSTVATAESCNDSFEFKISDEKATINIVTMQNRETTETSAEGPKENHLEIPIINRQSFEISTEEAHLSTAESSLIIAGIAVNTFDARKSETQKVHVDIVEQKGIVSILVCPCESHCDDIEIPKVITQKLKSHIETPILFVAETLIVVPLGHCDDNFDSRIGDELASVHVVAMQNYIITETIAEGPKEKNLEKLEMNHQKSKTYIEERFLSAAEMSSIISELTIIYFDNIKTEIQQIYGNIIEQKSIETFSIFPFEPNFEHLEIPEITATQPETLIDSSFFNVAETFRPISEEPRCESFETKVTDVQATVNIIAIQTFETTEITVEEPKVKTLEISAANQQRVQTEIEDCNLSVAELTCIVPEISVHIFDTKEIISQQCHVNVIEQKSVEHFVLCPWEANCEDLKISEAMSTQPEILIESPVLIVAEILTTILEGPHIDNFKIKVAYEQAEVNIVAIRLPGISHIIAEEPKVTNFEIPIINELKLKVGLEEIYLLTAQSLLLLPNDSVQTFKSRKMESQNVLIDVVEQKAIAIFFVVVWEPNYKDLIVQEIIKKVPQTLIVSSILAVAENLTFVFEEKVHEDSKTIKASVYQATTNFVKFKVAEKNVVFSEEPKPETFERPKLFMLEPQHSVVDKYLTVAENQIIFPIEPKEKILDATEIIGQHAHFEIEECKTAVSSIIFIEEPNIEEFITKGLVTNESENFLELTSKMIAQVTVINICEKEIEFSVPSQAVLKTGNIGIEALKPVAQSFFILIDDSKQGVCEYSKLISYQAKSTVIEAAATAVAQTIITNVTKHQSQKRTKAMERKHEVDISEIIDITHDVKNIDSIDITKYNVELAKDYEESFLMQQEKENYIKDVDLVTLSSVSTSSSISSAPSSPLIEEYVFGVKGHEYRVHSPQETSLDVISSHVDTAYKIQNMDTSMTIAIEAAIEKFQDTHIQKQEVYDIDVKKREFWISDVKINASMESADVNMNIMKSNIGLDTEQSSFQDLETSSALITKNRALSYDQAADFEVALESKDSEALNSDSQEVAIFDFRSGSSFESAKDIQPTDANLNIKMKSAKTLTAENFDVTYGLTIENEIMDYDKSMDLSVQISHESNTAKTNKRKVKKRASEHISLEESKSLTLEKSALIKESYANKEEMKAIYGLDISTSKKEMSLSETSFSAMEDKLESKTVFQTSHSSAMKGNLESKSIILEKATRSMEMDSSGHTGLMNIETQISNDAQSPSPPTVPSTPLTDYYMFRLQSPYPEESTFVPRDCSFTPESVDEDSLVIINGLVPHIDSKIERILYSPPLQTPDTSPERNTEVILTESDVKGGAQEQEFTKEEIRDIGRKSSLLASEIDKTIRSIEEYKESVGISAKKVEETKRVNLEKDELSAGKQHIQKIKAGQVDLSVTDADTSFEGTSETKVKGLKRRTVTHKGLTTSISGEQSITETQQSNASIGKSGSTKSSGIQSNSIQSSDIQSSSSKSSSSHSSGIQSSSIQSSETKSSRGKSSGFQTSAIQLSAIQSSDIQSSSIELSSSKSSGVQSSVIQSSGVQSSTSKSSTNKSNGIQSRSIELSSSKSSGVLSRAMQSTDIQSSGTKSSSSKSSGVQSSSIQSSGTKSGSSKASDVRLSATQSSGVQSSGIQSSVIQSSHIHSSSSKSSGVQSSSIQSSGTKSSSSKSSGVQSSSIQSSGTKSGSSKASDVRLSATQSSGVQSSGIQSSGIQSSAIQSSHIHSSSSKSSGVQSSSIQSSGTKSSSSKSSGIQSSNIQSSGTKSSSIQSSDIQSSSNKSTSSKSSSTKSDQKLHLLSRFS